MQTHLMAIDPSSTSTGLAVWDKDGEIVHLDRVIADRTDAPHRRIWGMCAEVVASLVEYKPEHVVIEWPATHQHVGIDGRAAGQLTYGCAVGAIWHTCMDYHMVSGLHEYRAMDHVHLANVSEWCPQKPKDRRARELFVTCDAYAKWRASGHTDPYYDVADAVQIGLWWLNRKGLSDGAEDGRITVVG